MPVIVEEEQGQSPGNSTTPPVATSGALKEGGQDGEAGHINGDAVRSRSVSSVGSSNDAEEGGGGECPCQFNSSVPDQGGWCALLGS